MFLPENYICDSSTVGSTPPCQGGGREFEPRLSLSRTRNPLWLPGFSFMVWLCNDIFSALRRTRAVEGRGRRGGLCPIETSLRNDIFSAFALLKRPCVTTCVTIFFLPLPCDQKRWGERMRKAGRWKKYGWRGVHSYYGLQGIAVTISAI